MYTPQSTCLCIPLANYTTTVQSIMYTHNRFHTKFPVIISCLYITYTHCTCTTNQHTRTCICVHEKKFTIYIIHVIVFLISASQNIKTMNIVLRTCTISEIFFWEQSKGFKQFLKSSAKKKFLDYDFKLVVRKSR